MTTEITTTLAALRQPETNNAPVVHAGFDTAAGFDLIQRTAKLFAASDIVPPQYQNNLPNCVIAVDMALRMGANPLMVCQNLYVVHGRPAWSAQFLIATLNRCGRFSSLRYEFQGTEGKDDWGCRAVAVELATGEKLAGPLITIGLAKKEGWYGKNGSKWQTMPELMLRYRAAAWFVRAYEPGLAMGLSTDDEIKDVYNVSQGENGVFEMTTSDLPDVVQPTQPKPEQPEATKAKPDTKKPASEAEPAAQPEASGHLITCPLNSKQVDEIDCPACPKRQGCPAWED